MIIKNIHDVQFYEVEDATTLKEAVEKLARAKKDLQGADLQGAYLQGTDLQGADLQGADLQGAYLQGAYLRGAYLRGAYLRGADLQGADLQGADLQGAYLQGADLQGAYLQGADLQGADLQGADLQGADLRGADLRGADLQGAKYGEVEVQRARVFTGLYAYVAIAILDTQGVEYIRLGCYFRTVKEWKKDFWNNPSEFPNDGSVKSLERKLAFDTCVKWLKINR